MFTSGDWVFGIIGGLGSTIILEILNYCLGNTKVSAGVSGTAEGWARGGVTAGNDVG